MGSLRTIKKDKEVEILPKGLIKKLKDYLGKDGRDFFQGCKSRYGTVSPVYMSGGIPHVVHYREGMSVRNFMRRSGFCSDWTNEDFDNKWTKAVELALIPD